MYSRGINRVLTGFLIMGFLLGELTNTLSNLDPVGNQYSTVKDHLAEFMNRHEFNMDLKAKLREYMSLSEHVFRAAHYQELLSSLSPQFRFICATQVYGYSVVSMPFMRYAVQAAHAVRVGSIVYVKPPQSRFGSEPAEPADELHMDSTARRARILEITDYLVYTVVYTDTLQTESDVGHSDLDIEMSFRKPSVRDQIVKLSYERDAVVGQLAQHFSSQVSMPRDTVIKRDVSMNDAMYLIDSGSVILFGGSSVKRFRAQLRGPENFFGEDVTTQFIGERRRRLVHYTAKTLNVTHLKVITADDLYSILAETPSFPHHCAHIQRYGCWLLIKSSVIQRFRAHESSQAAERGDHMRLTYFERRDQIAPQDISDKPLIRGVFKECSDSKESPCDDDDRSSDDRGETQQPQMEPSPVPEEVIPFLARWFVERATTTPAALPAESEVAELSVKLYDAVKAKQSQQVPTPTSLTTAAARSNPLIACPQVSRRPVPLQWQPCGALSNASL